MNRRMNMKNAKVRIEWSTLIFFVLFIAEVGIWLYFNITKQYLVDHDSAKGMYHTICMAREGRLVIPGWKYQTTGEWDCASFLALPIYLITKDIYQAFAIANCLDILIFASVVIRLFIYVDCKLQWSPLFALCVLLIPFSWGMLAYANMMFYGFGFYFWKTLVPIWFLLMLHHSGSWGYWVETLGFGLLVLALASSSGVYVFVCGLLPIILCRIVFVLSGKHISWKHLFLCVFTILCSAAGVLIKCRIPIHSPTEDMQLPALQDLGLGISNAFMGILKLLHVFSDKPIPIMSVTGILMLCRIALVIMIAILSFPHAIQFLGLFATGSSVDALEDRKILQAELISIFIWNLAVTVLTVSEERYHLIGVVPLIILAGMELTEWKNKGKVIHKVFPFLCAGLIMLVLIDAWHLCFKEANTVKGDMYDKIGEIAEDQHANTIVFSQDSGHAEMARLQLLGKKKVVTSFFNGMLQSNDDYDIMEDRGLYDDRHILVVSWGGDLMDTFEPARSYYTYIDEIPEENMRIYVAERNILDGKTGPLGSFSIDLPHNTQYETNGSFDNMRRLVLKENEFFSSPEMKTDDNAVEVSIICTQTHGSMNLSYNADGNEKKEEIFFKDGCLTFEVPKNCMFSFFISPMTGSDAVIDRIEYRKTAL